ncbi:MAG: DotH/IcmK family type IV secretion protein [Legionellaceae bacterium]|nr:DotH/IcmK family type IV secretion protein [Legionellaceae bacterium]
MKKIFKKNRYISLIMVVVSFIAFQANVTLASDKDSAKQALEQLKLLQSKISSEKESRKGGADKDLSKQKSNSVKPSSQANRAAESALQRRKRTASIPSRNANKNMAAANIIDQEKEEEIIDELAFKDVEKQLFPLDAEKIVKLRELYNKTELARTQSPLAPPKPTATSQFVNLSPGSTPPVIRLSQGFVSSLVFLDSTGAPWPITAYDLGDPTAFNIQWDKVSNTLMIQSSKLYTYGNLAVRLQGLTTPVMLTLIPGQKAVDYRVDLRVQGYGPNASNMPMEEGLPPSASDVLLHVLDGVPPQGSTRLIVSGGDARAWLLHGKMFVRTNLTILSPGWMGSMTSADGMHAYEMQKSPVLLVSWHGKVMQLKVEGL